MRRLLESNRCVVAEDRLLDGPQPRARVQTQGLPQQRASLRAHAQCVRLPAGAVQRGRQCHPQTLPQGRGLHQVHQLGDEARTATGRELGLEPILGHRPPQFLQPRRAGRDTGDARALGKHRPAPEVERPAQGGPLDRCRHVALEPHRVDVRTDQPVSGRDRQQCVAAGRPPQAGHVGLHHVHRGRGRFVAPQGVHQCCRSHRPAVGERQERQDGGLLRRARQQLLTIEPDLQRPEKQDLHRPKGRTPRGFGRPSALRRRSAGVQRASSASAQPRRQPLQTAARTEGGRDDH